MKGRVVVVVVVGRLVLGRLLLVVEGVVDNLVIILAVDGVVKSTNVKSKQLIYTLKLHNIAKVEYIDIVVNKWFIKHVYGRRGGGSHLNFNLDISLGFVIGRILETQENLPET